MFYQILTKAKAFLLFKLLYADFNLYQLFENLCKSLLAGYLANRFVCCFENKLLVFPSWLQTFFLKFPNRTYLLLSSSLLEPTFHYQVP